MKCSKDILNEVYKQIESIYKTVISNDSLESNWYFNIYFYNEDQPINKIPAYTEAPPLECIKTLEQNGTGPNKSSVDQFISKLKKYSKSMTDKFTDECQARLRFADSGPDGNVIAYFDFKIKGNPPALQLLEQNIIDQENCNPIILTTAFWEDSGDLCYFLLSTNPSLPIELFEKLLDTDDIYRIKELLANPNFPDKLISQISKEKRLKVAESDNTEIARYDIISRLLRAESIGSDIIDAISTRNDLNDVCREIVDFKVKINNLRSQHQNNSNYKWLEDSLLSITDWGKDLFEAIYKDKDMQIRSAIAKNPYLPEEMLFELSLDTEIDVKLSALGNSCCSQNILKNASAGKESYSSSRVRKAVALHPKTPKIVINQLLKDQYRWVREAAAAHEKIDNNTIKKLILTDDRYILKGLSINPNCDKGLQDKINSMLTDEKKYQIEKDTYVIGFDCNCYPSEEVAGEIPIDDIVNAIIEGYESWTDFVWDNNWYDYDDYYHAYGMRDTATHIKYPDGTMEPISIKEPKDYESCDIENCASEIIGVFVAVGTTYEKAHDGWNNWMKYSIELEYELIPDNIVPTYECGMVDGYNYDEEYFENDDLYSTTGKGSDFSLYIVTKSGLKSIDLDELISGIDEQGLNPEDEVDVRSYLEKI